MTAKKASKTATRKTTTSKATASKTTLIAKKAGNARNAKLPPIATPVSLGVPVDKAGRVIVNKDLTIPGHPEVQVIGDLAHFEDEKGRLLPGVSPVAMQQGRHAARNILAMVEGRKPQRFWYWDKGSMATIGRNKAVADLNFVHLSGFPAWLTWLFVHVLFLVSFRNRAAVIMQWAWAYFTFNKGARLITRNFQAEHRPPA